MAIEDRYDDHTGQYDAPVFTRVGHMDKGTLVLAADEKCIECGDGRPVADVALTRVGRREPVLLCRWCRYDHRALGHRWVELVIPD